MKFPSKALLLVLVFSGLFYGISVTFAVRHGSALLAKDVPLDSSCPLKELPNDAEGVSYFYGGMQGSTYYEFDIGEEQFVDWIETIQRFKKWPAEQSMRRFNLNGPDIEWVNMPDGIAYFWRDQNAADRTEQARYDRKTGRCYYSYMAFYAD